MTARARRFHIAIVIEYGYLSRTFHLGFGGEPAEAKVSISSTTRLDTLPSEVLFVNKQEFGQ